MPAIIRVEEVEAEVSGEEPLDHVNNPNERKFVPAWIKVRIEGEWMFIAVRGPLLTNQGKQLKTWGACSFDRDDIKDRTAPQWVLDLVERI